MATFLTTFTSNLILWKNIKDSNPLVLYWDIATKSIRDKLVIILGGLGGFGLHFAKDVYNT